MRGAASVACLSTTLARVQCIVFGAYSALATEPMFVDKACLGPSLLHYIIFGYSSSYKISLTLIYNL